jgi:hypothetical protein
MSISGLKVVDTFDRSSCGVCGGYEVNQYFGISDSFINYDGKFLSLREVLRSALDFQVNSSDSRDYECDFHEVLLNLDQRKGQQIHRDMSGVQGQSRQVLSLQEKIERNSEAKTPIESNANIEEKEEQQSRSEHSGNH